MSLLQLHLVKEHAQACHLKLHETTDFFGTKTSEDPSSCLGQCSMNRVQAKERSIRTGPQLPRPGVLPICTLVTHFQIFQSVLFLLSCVQSISKVKSPEVLLTPVPCGRKIHKNYELSETHFKHVKKKKTCSTLQVIRKGAWMKSFCGWLAVLKLAAAKSE